APDFLVTNNLHGLLSECAGVESPDVSGRHATEIDNTEVGRVSLSYRTEQLRSRDLDNSSGGSPDLVLDEYGRPLEFLYGVVSRQRLPGEIDERDLQHARGEAVSSYRLFLANEEAFRVNVSKSFQLHGTGTPVLHLDTDSPPPDFRISSEVLAL